MESIEFLWRSRLHRLAMICVPLAILAASLSAQTAPGSAAPNRFAYDKAHEITVNGSIQSLSNERVSGSPVGLHLFVAASQGVVDVSFGPYVSKETQEALHTGTAVQIVGAMETIRGKNYLLARQLIFGGRLVTIRNENGMPIRTGENARAKRSNTTLSSGKNSQGELN
jgi:hypothetical protein